MTLSSIQSTLSSGIKELWKHTKSNPKKVALTALAIGVAGLAGRYLLHSYSLYFVKIPARINELTDPNSEKYNPSIINDMNAFRIDTLSSRLRPQGSTGINSFFLNLIPDFFLTRKVFLTAESNEPSGWFSPKKCDNRVNIGEYLFKPLPISDWLTKITAR